LRFLLVPFKEGKIRIEIRLWSQAMTDSFYQGELSTTNLLPNLSRKEISMAGVTSIVSIAEAVRGEPRNRKKKPTQPQEKEQPIGNLSFLFSPDRCSFD